MKKQFLPLVIGILLIVAGVGLAVFVLTSPSERQDPENELLLPETEVENEHDISQPDNAEEVLPDSNAVTDDIIDEQEDSDNTEKALPDDNAITDNDNAEQEHSDVENDYDDLEEPDGDDANERKMSVDTSLWNMILVNPDNYLPDDFTIETAQVQGNYYLDSRVAPYAIQMIEDAKKEGIELQICSSIRGIDLQTRLYNNKINDLIEEEGLSREEAEKKAATIVAVPGTSEHHTGLALDIVTPSYQRLNSGYAETDAAKWLKNNAAKYGFILRYPEDKTEITKIIFEPWHYRYVGVEYAEFIMSEGICFEEFIELYGVSGE